MKTPSRRIYAVYGSIRGPILLGVATSKKAAEKMLKEQTYCVLNSAYIKEWIPNELFEEMQ